MRTLYCISILLSTACCPVFCAQPLVRVDAFSKLNQGDTLVVLFHNSGCFHSETHEFTFCQTSNIAVSVVRVLRVPAGAGAFTAQTNRVDLGSLVLSKADVVGLDKLMQFYRSEHHTFSTEVDRITFIQKRNGKPVVTEEIMDDSGQMRDVSPLSAALKDYTRFPDLIARLGSPKP